MARITILGHAVGIRYIFCDITADYNRKMRLLVLAAVLFLACMDPGRDSLLYANFQADVSSKHD